MTVKARPNIRVRELATELAVSSKQILDLLDEGMVPQSNIGFDKAEAVRTYFSADTIRSKEDRELRAADRERGAAEGLRIEAEKREFAAKQAREAPETTSDSEETKALDLQKEVDIIFSAGPDMIVEKVQEGFFDGLNIDIERVDLIKKIKLMLAEDDPEWDVECYVGMPVTVMGIRGLGGGMFGFITNILDPETSTTPPLLYVAVGAWHPQGRPMPFPKLQLMRPAEVLPSKPYAVPWEKPDAV